MTIGLLAGWATTAAWAVSMRRRIVAAAPLPPAPAPMGAAAVASSSLRVMAPGGLVPERLARLRAEASSIDTTMSSAAVAIGQLSYSIQEISQRVNEASVVTEQAAAHAAATEATVEQLSDRSRDIGRMLEVITDISEQTNLLALNATLEAARAGHAGRGFAVVAAEVKELAGQTGAAASEIGAPVAAVQQTSRNVADTLRAMAATIGQVNEQQVAIAAAVDEQSSSTAALSGNVTDAASGTHRIAADISHLGD